MMNLEVYNTSSFMDLGICRSLAISPLPSGREGPAGRAVPPDYPHGVSVPSRRRRARGAVRRGVPPVPRLGRGDDSSVRLHAVRSGARPLQARQGGPTFLYGFFNFKYTSRDVPNCFGITGIFMKCQTKRRLLISNLRF